MDFHHGRGRFKPLKKKIFVHNLSGEHNHIWVKIMKKAYVISLAIFASGCASNSGVDDNGNENGPGEKGIKAVAVGEYASIFEFDGESWNSVEAPIPQRDDNELSDVSIIDHDRAVIVGSNGNILFRKSNTWKKMDSSTGNHLTGVAALDEDFIVAVGQSGIILKYDGETWAEMDSPVDHIPDFFLMDVALYSQDFGVAVGGWADQDLSGVVLVFDGVNWAIERQHEDRNLITVGIASPDHIAVGGYSSFIEGDPINLKEKRGSTWNQIQGLPWRRHLTGITFYDAQYGLGVTDGGGTGGTQGGSLILEYDGAQWSSKGTIGELAHVSSALDDVCLIDPDYGFAVGNDVLVEYKDQRWRSVDLSAYTQQEPDLALFRAVDCLHMLASN